MRCHKNIPPFPSGEKTVLQKVGQTAFKSNSTHTVCEKKIKRCIRIKSVSYLKLVKTCMSNLALSK